MKRTFGLAMMCAGLAIPLMAAAQGGSMMGGARGGSTTGSSSSSMMSDGEVRKIDSAAGKLTLRHGPLENMDMPAMTMVFRVRDPAWLSQLRVGDRVRFVAERVDGNLTVTAIALAKE